MAPAVLKTSEAICGRTMRWEGRGLDGRETEHGVMGRCEVGRCLAGGGRCGRLGRRTAWSSAGSKGPGRPHLLLAWPPFLLGCKEDLLRPPCRQQCCLAQSLWLCLAGWLRHLCASVLGSQRRCQGFPVLLVDAAHPSQLHLRLTASWFFWGSTQGQAGITRGWPGSPRGRQRHPSWWRFPLSQISCWCWSTPPWSVTSKVSTQTSEASHNV